jgi:hypothetical protein
MDHVGSHHWVLSQQSNVKSANPTGSSFSAASHLPLMYSKVSRAITATRCVLLNRRVFPVSTAWWWCALKSRIM